MAQKRRRWIDETDIAMLNPLQGSWVDDPIYSYLRGFDRSTELVRSVSYLYAEVEEVTNRLFPYRWSKSDTPEFSIEYIPDNITQKLLQSHLVDDEIIRGRGSRSGLYPNMGLKELLVDIANLLLRDGSAYYAIDWGTFPEDIQGLILPVRFRYLRTSTMDRKIDMDGTVTYYQQYNELVAPDKHEGLQGARFEFKDYQVFYSTYFMGQPPVRLASRLAEENWRLLQKLTDKLAASVNPEDMRYGSEKLRQQSNDDLQREYHVTRAKIRKIFNLPVYKPFWESSEGLSDLIFSEHYQGKRLINFLLYVESFRSFLIQEFNFNVMRRIGRFNSFPETPRLIYKGDNPTESEMEAGYSDLLAGKLTYHELLKQFFRY